MKEGKCEFRRKMDIPNLNPQVMVDHVFFREHLYDPTTGVPCLFDTTRGDVTNEFCRALVEDTGKAG